MTTTLSRPQPTPTLTPYLHELQQVTGAEVVFGGVAGDLDSPVVLNTFLGTRSDGLRNLQLTSGLGLGGKAMATGRPIHVRDYYAASGITHDYDAAVRQEGLHAIFAVPIRTAGGLHGLMYGGLRRPELIGDRLLGRAVDVARRWQYDADVTTEVNRRLGLGDPAELQSQIPATSIDQRLRDVHAELGLIRRTAESGTRQLIDDLMRRLASSIGIPITTGGTGSLLCPAPNDTVCLTPRELDVITQVAIGCSNAAVGARLGLGEATVKSYLHSASRKLGARNRVEAVAAARRQGLIP